MGLLNIGTSGLTAAYAQLQTTGHNIANVNTPGYHRQEALQASVEATSSGAGFFGRGVEVVTIKRQYDQYLEREANVAQASAEADRARAQQMGSLETVFGDSASGLGATLDDLRSSLADLVGQPADSAVRATAYGRAQALVSRVQDVGGRLDRAATDVDQRVSDMTGQLNALLDKLAKLNNAVSLKSGTGHVPNDMLDQRDQLVGEVNKLVKTNAYIAPDNTVNLYTGGGEALLVNTSPSMFGVRTDPLDATKLQVVLKTQGADVAVDGAKLGGGAMAGLIRFRDDDLASVRTRVGQMVGALADAFNQAQARGVDATGASGSPMFGVGAPSIAAATTNLGNATLGVTVTSAASLQASDYVVSWNGTNYVATRQSDNTTTTLTGLPGAPATLDGLTISVGGGTPQAGDRFMLRAASAVTSGFNLALASPQRLATGLPAMPLVGAANRGDLSVAGFQVVTPGAANAQTVSFTFNANGTYDVVAGGTTTTGVAWTPGTPISVNGWSMTLKGTPVAGDTLTVAATASTATDNRNARALFDVASQKIVAGRSFGDAYGDLIADVGNRSKMAQSAATMSAQSAGEATAARDTVSGVNLDEEAARLIQYQQAYQAAAKLIASAQTMFDAILKAAG